jgi:hypothetical protein
MPESMLAAQLVYPSPRGRDLENSSVRLPYLGKAQGLIAGAGTATVADANERLGTDFEVEPVSVDMLLALSSAASIDLAAQKLRLDRNLPLAAPTLASRRVAPKDAGLDPPSSEKFVAGAGQQLAASWMFLPVVAGLFTFVRRAARKIV